MGVLTNPRLQSTSGTVDRFIVRLLPSLTDFAFAFPAVWLFYLMQGTTSLLADGDTAWHIRTGEWIWKHKAVPTTDLFSFTRSNSDWYAWEWLWDTSFSFVHLLGGLSAVAFVNVLIISLISVLLFRLVRRTTENDALSLGCTALAMATSSIHWLARPHLFTWVFLLLFAHCLLSVRNGNWRALIPLPFCMLLWTNLHGGFFLGIILLLLAAAGEVTAAFLHSENFWQASLKRARPYFVCALLCSLATFVNPYGWRLHSHIAHYVVDGKLLSQIGEFKSMDFHTASGLLFEIMLMLALPAVLWACTRKQYAVALGILCWGHMAIYSARNIPIFALLVAPAIASMLHDVFGRLAYARRLQRPLVSLAALGARFQPIERMARLPIWSAAFALSLAALFASGAPGFEGAFHPISFPVSALPVVSTGRFSRLFTTDTWASYFVYNLYPKQPSFLDGRSDLFGSAFMDTYCHIINARWDWEETLNHYAVDGVVLRPNLPVVAALKASPNWHLLFDDGAVVIFERTPATRAALQLPRETKASPVRLDGRKQLGLIQPGPTVSSVQETTHERRSS